MAVKKVVKKAKTVTKAKNSEPELIRRPRPRRARPKSSNNLLADAMNRLAAATEKNDPEHDRRVRDAANKALQKRLEKERKDRIAAGTFLLEDLEHVIKVGEMYYTYYQGELMAGKVTGYYMNRGFMGSMFNVTISVITIQGDGSVGYGDYTIRMKEWVNPRTWNEISIRPMTDDILARLEQRGRIFRDVVKNPSYMNYVGEVYIPSWYGWFPMGGNGRVIVDAQGCRTMMPHILSSMIEDFRDRDDDDTADVKFEIVDSELYMTSPFVTVFSFRQKRWVAAKVESLSSIVFQTDVFDKLVLDDDKKFIVKSLVEHSGSSFSDIIGGKSGGFIFLLHGPPGVGKTLTAEATAETLQRPLYMVSVGELGTKPDQLETKLAQILELADRWNAVLLLDEADIFLEQRTDHDLERNAMVGIFLRLLEYFNGVLFLTTNRVKNFDRAFHSRISLAINYQEMTTDIRTKIWTNLLAAANVTGVDIDELAKKPLNGRQIKNSIRLAQTIALAKHTSVDNDLLLTMADYAEEFVKSLTTTQNYA